jgi:4-hydroxy-3-methylbut-2-enyl diphosphate reductase
LKITVAENAGFCFGVKNAVNLALKVNKTENVYSYGELIHNSIVINQLKEKGIQVKDNIKDIPDNSTVLVKGAKALVESL